MEKQVEQVKKEAVDREKVRRKKERALETVVQASDEKNNGKRGFMGFGSDDAMDIDDDAGSSRTTRGKRGPGGFGFSGMGKRLG